MGSGRAGLATSADGAHSGRRGQQSFRFRRHLAKSTTAEGRRLTVPISGREAEQQRQGQG